MIKVIKHGTRKVSKCSECECVFTYEKEDEIVEHVDYNEHCKYIICPDCGTKLLVDVQE